MELTISQMQGRVPVTILQTHGEIDASNYQDLIDKARELYAAGTRDMLLDLSDTTYMSSSGVVALQSIAALLRGDALPDPEAGWGAYRAIDRDRDSGCQQHFKLLSPKPRVDSVLEMIGFKRFLEVFTDRETALAAF